MSTIDLVTLKAIRRMLRAGVRHAEIARRLDLAVGTISRIASVRRLRRLKLHLLAEDELPEDDQPPEYLAANLRRCLGCGGMVYQWPCLACRMRADQEAGIALADGDGASPCAPTGQPAIALGAAQGLRLPRDLSAPQGRAELPGAAGERAPMGLMESPTIDLSRLAFPGLRPGLSQVGPLGRTLALQTLTAHQTPGPCLVPAKYNFEP